MLKSSLFTETPATQKLVRLWANRYLPRIPLSQYTQSLPLQLRQAATPEGRSQTAEKLRSSLVVLSCEFASLQAQDIHNYIPNVFDFNEARQISESATKVYLKLIDIYQKGWLEKAAPASSSVALRQENPIYYWEPSAIIELANLLEPLLLEHQAQYVASKDWHAQGFLTTHFNFSNQVLLNRLTFPEQILIQPYFKFVEEQVALPWQRVCAAAAKYDSQDPRIQLLEEMLPIAEEIAQVVYNRLLQHFPKQESRRGKLNHPGVKHSCLRDLNMFQAYLWLCVLQKSLAPITEELAIVCMMVMQRVGVPLIMTAHWNEYLMDEIILRVGEARRPLVLTYAKGIQAAFYQLQD